MSDLHKAGTESQSGSTNFGLMIGVFVLGFFGGYIVSILTSSRNALKQEQEVAYLGQEQVKIECPSTTVDVVGQPASSESSYDSQASSHELVITKEQRARMLSLDFVSLLHDADIQKYRFEGETRGIRLNKIRTGSIFDRAGFKNGDIIEQINGLAVADLGRSLDTAKEDLPKASKITLKVRRDDKLISIRIRVAGD